MGGRRRLVRSVERMPASDIVEANALGLRMTA
jgi:hypothetical protein